MKVQLDQCPFCLVVFEPAPVCPNCQKQQPGYRDQMIYCDLDTRHHHPRRPKYPRWLLDELQRQLEFAYAYTRTDNGNDRQNQSYNMRQDTLRRYYVIAFLNGYDTTRPQLSALKSIEAIADNYKTGDGTKVGRIYKILSNLKNKLNGKDVQPK